MNLNEFTDLNDYMDILNNLCIYITYLYSIILILDELYNIGIFTYNYTHNYNYGLATQKFNTINTIECETSRYKIYNNINFLKNDIFNNTYLNYLITVFITIITIISCISYGIFFYYRIINNIFTCKFDIDDELMSIPKRFLKCICNDCHKILPNCSMNYIILLIIILVIPITYIIKLFLKYDYTPTSNTSLLIIIIVLFSYIYNIYINNDKRDTIIIIKEILIFIFFTIIFIITLIIHKNIYDIYNDTSLNSNLNDSYIIYDIYKQLPPNKPSPVPLPVFNGINLLENFKLIDGGDNTDINYDKKKEILDKYYSNKKDYEKSMVEYNIKNDIYNSTIKKQELKLGDKIYFFDIMYNIFGIKNKINIVIIVLIIILIALYYYFDDNLFLSGIIYLINVLILITLINAITYYNTYLNKYIIYEPLAYYKNDLTVANTKLNMYFNPSSGTNFYNILNNDKSINYNVEDNLSKNQIISDIKSLTNISNFNNDNIQMIITNINDYNKFNTNINLSKNDEIDAIIYYKEDANKNNPIKYLFSNIKQIIINENNKIDNFKIINTLKLNFSSNAYNIYIDFSNYYAYIYYKLCFYKAFILLKLINFNYSYNKTELLNLYDSIEKIFNLLKPYKKNVSYTPTIASPLSDDIFNKNLIEEAIVKLVNELALTGDDAITTKNNYYNDILNNINILLFSYDKDKTTINFNIDINSMSNTPLSINTTPAASTPDASTPAASTPPGYTLTINNDVLSKIETTKIQPSILFSSSNYYELPNKITDNNNNDIIITVKNTTTTTFITNTNTLFYFNNQPDKSLTYTIKSNYKNDPNTNTFRMKTDLILTNTIDSSKYDITPPSTPPTPQNIVSGDLYIPSKIYKTMGSQSYDVNLKKIIFSVLYDNLTNITTQFVNIDLQKLFIASDTIIKEIKYYNFSTLFQNISSIKEVGINYNMDNLNKFIDAIYNITDITKDTNILGFIIVLFNIYNFNINKIIAKIEYIIYMQKSNVDNIIYNSNINNISSLLSNSNFVKNLNTIETKIIKPKNNIDYDRNDYIDKNLIEYYEKNKYYVNLILNIYSNIFSNIKNVISTIDKNNLCFSTNDKYTIEKNLYTHIIKYYTLNNTPLTSQSTANIKLTFFNKENRKKIFDINKQIINFFKISDFLFKNTVIDDSAKNILKQKDEIIKNYNFYNPELYNNITDFINEELIINCNYVNKYNNMETNKLDLFKFNCDNVSYNFPVLIIIFVAILGEGFFLK